LLEIGRLIFHVVSGSLAAAERTTKQIVRGYIDKLLNEPELKYVLDIMRQDDRIL